MKNTFHLDVDIKNKSYIDEPVVTQNDDVSFILSITDDGLVYDLKDYISFAMASKRPDGQSVLSSGVKTNDNEITFNLGSTEVESVGRVDVAIQLYASDGRISSIPFTYQVIKDLSEDYIPSQKEQTLIEVIMLEAQQKIDELSDVDIVSLERKVDDSLNSVNSKLAQTESKKADKTEINRIDSQMAQRPTRTEARLKKEKIEPEDASERLMALVTGEGIINLESIPQDYSVDLEKLNDSSLMLDYTKSQESLNLPLTTKGSYEINLFSKGDIFLSNGNLFDIFNIESGTYNYEDLNIVVDGDNIKINGTLSRNMYLKLSDGVLFGTSTTEAELTKKEYPIPNLSNFRFGWYNLQKNVDVPNMTMAIRSLVSGNVGSVGVASSNTNTGVSGGNWGAMYLFLPMGSYQVEFDGLLLAYDPYIPEYEKPANTQIVKSVNKARVSLGSEHIFTSEDGVAFKLINIYENLQQVKENPQNKQIYVEGNTDYFNFYIKGSDKDSRKHLRYRFDKYVNEATNANGWVLGVVDAVELIDGVWNYLYPVIMRGEWEMAVRIAERPDFIGTKEHGSEINYYEKFYIDGTSWTPNDDSFWCDEIRIIQKSDMYDPNDEVTLVGKHNKDYSIIGNSISIKQKIDWLANLTMDRSYVTMLPIIRGNDSETNHLISHYAFDDYNLEEIDVSSTGHGAKTNDHEPTKWNLYSNSTGISAEVQTLIKNKPDEAMSFVQNTDKYNKVYFTYCELGYEVNIGDIWEWESFYKLNISA